MHAGRERNWLEAAKPSDECRVIGLQRQLGQDGPEPASLRVLDADNAIGVKAKDEDGHCELVEAVGRLYAPCRQRLGVEVLEAEQSLRASKGDWLRSSPSAELGRDGPFASSAASTAREAHVDDCRLTCSHQIPEDCLALPGGDVQQGNRRTGARMFGLMENIVDADDFTSHIQEGTRKGSFACT